LPKTAQASSPPQEYKKNGMFIGKYGDNMMTSVLKTLASLYGNHVLVTSQPLDFTIVKIYQYIKWVLFTFSQNGNEERKCLIVT